jgi:hypothetical protein
MADPWSKFFWSDWEADQGLRLCSLSAQGLWMRMLCVCARHDPKGYLAINGHPLTVDAIARLAGVAETEAGSLLEELERNGVFSRNRSGCIFSRRMVRDEKRSQEGRKHKKRGLSQAYDMKGENDDPSRVAARGPSPHIPEARSQSISVAKATSWPFADFWDKWPNKVSKANAEKAWSRLSEQDKADAIGKLGPWFAWWRAAFPTASPIHAATYLNQRRWRDEISAVPRAVEVHGNSSEQDKKRARWKSIASQ